MLKKQLQASSGDMALAIDFRKGSGAETLVVFGGGLSVSVKDREEDDSSVAKAKIAKAYISRSRSVKMTLQAGDAREVIVDGERVRVGEQSIRFADGKLVLEK